MNLYALVDLRDDGDFAFATGSVRVREARLLSTAQLQRLLEAPAIAETWQLLQDMAYIRGDREPDQYERVLHEELIYIYKYLASVSYKPELTDWLAGRYDFHNLKVYLKAKLLSERPEESVIESIGLVTPKLIEQAVQTEVWEALPKPLAKAGAEAAAEYERSRSGQLVDVIVDAHQYAYLQEQTADHTFLRRVVAVWCDLANLKALLRAKLLGEDRAFASRLLLPEGELSRLGLLELFDTEIAGWADELRHTPYARLMGQTLAAWQERHSLALLERLSDEYLVQLLQTAKLAPYGVEPLVAYVLMKELEIKNVRIVLVCKLNGLSRDAIEERLRYV